ncbi:MAG TPA: hypothetical protein VFF32_15765 [Dermatophilaceae bacterium]|nr:hypothetical protein [Dermatophilaceae bacterium]
MPPQHQVYRPAERPDVEALIDGQWRPGELRAWTQHEDGTRTFDVQYQPVGTNSRTIGTFTADEIRSDTVDRSRGRAG